MTKWDEHLVFLIEYFDHTVHNVMFECLVLNVYGNSLITLSSKSMVYFSFHAYVTDIVNNVIINVSIKGAFSKTNVELIKKLEIVLNIHYQNLNKIWQGRFRLNDWTFQCHYNDNHHVVWSS